MTAFGHCWPTRHHCWVDGRLSMDCATFIRPEINALFTLFSGQRFGKMLRERMTRAKPEKSVPVRTCGFRGNWFVDTSRAQNSYFIEWPDILFSNDFCLCV